MKKLLFIIILPIFIAGCHKDTPVNPVVNSQKTMPVIFACQKGGYFLCTWKQYINGTIQYSYFVSDTTSDSVSFVRSIPVGDSVACISGSYYNPPARCYLIISGVEYKGQGSVSYQVVK